MTDITSPTGLPLCIETDFAVMGPDKTVHVEHFDEGLYSRLDTGYKGFAGHELISCHTFSTDWGSWEVHPNGDEVVILLSGEVTFVLQSAGGDVPVHLDRQGQYVVVPQGVWHTARTEIETKLLFITPGEGTQHREAEERMAVTGDAGGMP